jgi:hypothetical protein
VHDSSLDFFEEVAGHTCTSKRGGVVEHMNVDHIAIFHLRGFAQFDCGYHKRRWRSDIRGTHWLWRGSPPTQPALNQRRRWH